MKIAIDARELCGTPTGVGRYLDRILDAWMRLPEARAHEFVLCAPAGDALPVFEGLRVTVCSRPGGGTRWEQLVLPGLLRASGADVLFSPGYTGPLRCPVPMVVAVHDVSFAAHPDWFSWREGARRRTITRMAAVRAARVLTISRFSQREIATYLGIGADRVTVIYPGVTRVGPAGDAHRPPSGSGGGTGGAVLYVGSIFTRRHVPALIEGFAQVAHVHPEATLDIVGDNRTSPRIDLAALVTASGVPDRVRVRAYVQDDTLAALYDEARAFVFLSSYEGFGLTPLEALAAGVPPIVLDTPVARETCGDAAMYVARPEPSLVAGAIEAVLFDTSTRRRLTDAAPAILARYDWDRCAAAVLDVLLDAGRSRVP